MKQVFVLLSPEIALNAARFVHKLPVSKDHPLVVEIKEVNRTLEQNALLWPLLECMAKQTTWHGHNLSKEEWKDLLSAGLVKMKVVPNLDGDGFVMLGQRTSKMSKRMFSDLIELIYAAGTELGVVFDRKIARAQAV
jgi:hypothetical protein